MSLNATVSNRIIQKAYPKSKQKMPSSFICKNLEKKMSDQRSKSLFLKRSFCKAEAYLLKQEKILNNNYL